ncbi:DUF4390 domain-containing protein [Niveibacterium umoris]|uniref:DUF4390 domain-containing protein n=1 Tax=Niveibacterium umoris TaxID=1193620 RepID=UPI001F5D171C|nr:DUF4390 domain-containing protein [Niveibacterium umoris]
MRALLLVAALLLAAFAPLAQAQSTASIRYAELLPTDDQYILNADISVELNPRLEEIVLRGIALNFVAECILTRSRWYWLDETIVERRVGYRLTYHALTQKYRLAVGALGQNFDSLGEALRTMTRLRNWSIVDRSRLRGGDSYNVALRFRLDTEQLPKPFQVTAIGSRDWSLETDWSRWTFLAAPAEHR